MKDFEGIIPWIVKLILVLVGLTWIAGHFGWLERPEVVEGIAVVDRIVDVSVPATVCLGALAFLTWVIVVSIIQGIKTRACNRRARAYERDLVRNQPGRFTRSEYRYDKK